MIILEDFLVEHKAEFYDSLSNTPGCFLYNKSIPLCCITYEDNLGVLGVIYSSLHFDTTIKNTKLYLGFVYNPSIVNLEGKIVQAENVTYLVRSIIVETIVHVESYNRLIYPASSLFDYLYYVYLERI